MSLNLDRLSILIAEDVAPMRELLSSVLENLGISNVRTFSNGKAAYAEFQKSSFDIVITDWDMPEMNGIELTKKIRTDMLSPNKLVPIIMITGYSYLSRVSLARDAGVTEILVKPFTANHLAHRLAYVVNKPRDFIDAPGYFGPDRRRKKDTGYKGPFRRNEDNDAIDIVSNFKSTKER